MRQHRWSGWPDTFVWTAKGSLLQSCMPTTWRRTMQARIDSGLCGQCGKEPLAPGRKKCRGCLDRYNGYELQKMQKWRKAGLCITCGRKKSARSKSRCSSCLSKIREAARLDAPKMRAKNARHRVALKQEVYAAYGGFVCACCGETEPKFLCLDHVENDGARHRKEMGGGGDRILRWLKRNGFPRGFRVVCANCNQGKQLNGGVCPHQESRVTQTA